ncbi:MAG: trypsin-like serine protease [Chloroflexota bacterium]|jgi:V8-like Glu-specific endopeptidase
MRKLLLIVSLLLVFSATPALAITDGELDRNGHPMVGLMVAFDRDDEPLWRCSGTLIAPQLYLTAGHCTEPPAVSAQIWFDADVQNGIPGNGYGDDGGWVGDVGGTTYTHPQYDPAAFWRWDLGMVVLDRPVRVAEYGQLPELDELDRFQRKAKKNKAWFTAVGYGLQKAFPSAAAWKDVAERIRMVSYPKLIQINVRGSTGTQSLILSNNAKTGGTCFGDSGGPNFVKDTLVIGAVTSFGKNGTCAGQGGVYRVDREDDLDWIYNTFGSYLP